MSASRNRAKLKRRVEKTKRKNAKRELYRSYAEAGRNTKSKRFALAVKRNRSSPTKHQHVVSNCGNAGCNRCFPRS